MRKRIFMLSVVLCLLLGFSASAWSDDHYFFKLNDITGQSVTTEDGVSTVSFTINVMYEVANEDDEATLDTDFSSGWFKNANLVKFTIGGTGNTFTPTSIKVKDTDVEDNSDPYYLINLASDGVPGAGSFGDIPLAVVAVGTLTNPTEAVPISVSLYQATNPTSAVSEVAGTTVATDSEGGTSTVADTAGDATTTFSIAASPTTLTIYLGETDETITITPTSALGDVTYASNAAWVTVDDEGVVTVAPTVATAGDLVNTTATVTITGTDDGRTGTKTATATLSITVISHDVRDYDDSAWNGLDPAFTNTISGDYDKAKPALGKVDKSNLSFTGGTPKDLVVPMTGPIETLTVYIAAKDAAKLYPDAGLTKDSDPIVLNKANIKTYNIPFRITSYDLKTTASGADAKARAKSWKNVTSTVTLSFNGGNVQYKGFPITISMSNSNTSSKPVAKTLKVNVEPNTDLPYWVYDVQASKDVTEDADEAEEWASEDGQSAVATYKTVYVSKDIYSTTVTTGEGDDATEETVYATAADWGLTTYTKDVAFQSSDKEYYVVPTKMDTSYYIEVTPYTENTDNYVYTTKVVTVDEVETIVSDDILTDEADNPVKASDLSLTEGTNFTKDESFVYTITEATDTEAAVTATYIVPTYARTTDIIDTDATYTTNSGNYIYTTQATREVDYYTLYADEYEAYDKKDKPEVVAAIDTTEKAVVTEFDRIFTASGDGKYTITVKPDPTSDKDKTKIANFFEEGVEAITIVQPTYDYLGNVVEHGYVSFVGTPKNTEKENKLAFTLTATNTSTKKKGALKVTAIAKTIPAFDKTTTIDGEKWITTKRVEAGKTPSVKFKAKGSKTIAYKLGNYYFDEDDKTIKAEDEDYNTELAEKLAALALSFDEKKGSVILASKSNKNTLPTLNEAGDAFQSLDIVVTAYNNAGSAQAWASVAITGAKPKLETKSVTFSSTSTVAELTAKAGKSTAGADTAGANIRYNEDPNSSVKFSDLGLTLYHYDTLTALSDDYGEVASTDYYAEGEVIYPFVAANVVSGEVTSKDATEYEKGYVFTEKPTLEYGEVKETKATKYEAGAEITGYDATNNLNGGAVTTTEGTTTVDADNTVYYANDSGTDTVYVVTTDVAYVLEDNGTSTLYYAGEGGVYYLNGEKYIGGLGTYTEVVSADASYKNKAVIKVTDASKLIAAADSTGKKDKKYKVSLILENLGATNKGNINIVVGKALAASNGALPGSNKANAYSTADANGNRTRNGTAAYSYNGALPGSDADAKADADAEQSEKLTIGAERTAADLTAGQQAFLAEKGYKVIAVLPEISANVEGQHKLEDIELDEDAPENATLIWVAFPKNAPASEDDDIVDFYDEAGAPVEGVPASHKIIAYPWLREAVTYEPVIAIEAE